MSYSASSFEEKSQKGRSKVKDEEKGPGRKSYNSKQKN
jgi:hypothetical protein